MVRKKLTNLYKAAHKRSREHLYHRPYILPIIGLFIGAGIVLGVVFTRHGHSLKVSDYHVVFVFDKGQRETINTKAKTVGELVKKLPLDLKPQDVVEPGLNSPIPEDNYRINIYRARPVTVVDGGVKEVTLTAQRSPRVVAEDAKLQVFAEDEVVFQQGNLRNNTLGEEVVVKRATTVKLNLYDDQLTLRTLASTVGDLLKQKNITLDKGDTIRPKITTRIHPGLEIAVIHNGTKTITREEKVEAPTQYVTDSSLSFGAEAVRQAGKAGRVVLTYRITTKEGKVVKRKILQRVVVEEPVPKIVARGSIVDVAGNKQAIMAAAGISGGDFGYVNYVISRESNWNPSARNAGGCLGLGQACPGSKLTAICSLSDPVCQLRYFTGYANGRYGGWGGAYNFWASHGYW